MTIHQRISVIFTLLLLSIFAAPGFAANHPSTPTPQAAQTSASPQTEKVNINTADAETLAKMLKGVGLVKAKAIISFREQNGPFATADDLTQVKGIGPATVKKNAEVIVVK